MSDDKKPQVRAAEPQEIKTWMDRNEIMLVDVRETSEFEREHIAGALLLPLSTLEPDIFPTLPGKKIVLHCAVGKRSAAAGKMLLNAGHSDIAHMTGGLDAWKAAGFATEIQIVPPNEEAPEPVFLCPHPGVILKGEYLDPLGISAGDLASRIGVLEGRVADVINGKANVGVELSLRLARFFSTAADFWVHLQIEHDMEQARYSIGEDIRAQITPRTSSD